MTQTATEYPAHVYTHVDPSRLGRGDLMRACADRKLPHIGTNIQLIDSINQWQEANGVSAPPPVEVEQDDEPDLGLDDTAAPATGEAPSAVAPVAGKEDTVRVSRTDWEAMQAQIAALMANTPVAGQPVISGPLTIAAPATGAAPPEKTGVFPGGYREEFEIGYRDIDDVLHFKLIEEAHHAAWEAGHRTKGAPHAGKRIGFSSRRGVRTAIYEVALNKSPELPNFL
jgi:hypothetical protein